MRHLWFVPTLHLSVERKVSPGHMRAAAIQALGSSERADAFELAVIKSWEATARELLRMVGEFGHYERLHVFSEGMMAYTGPVDPFRFFYEAMAEQGSMQMALALALEATGAHLHAVDIELFPTTPLQRVLSHRLRDEEFARHIMADVPDEHVAILMIGAGHEAERLIRERSDFAITRVGTMADVYAEFFSKLQE